MRGANIEKILPGIKKNILLAPYTTFKIGGPASWFFEARETEEIIKAVKVASELKIPYFILGGGSNILVSDKGLRGLVIKISTSKIKILGETLFVESGASLGEAVEKAKNHSLSGLEFAAGIPGTIGEQLGETLERGKRQLEIKLFVFRF